MKSIGVRNFKVKMVSAVDAKRWMYEWFDLKLVSIFGWKG